ncbi:MAG: hypothetical protein LUG66_06230 [Clostridiales bacterium]|nr:hypothetical protein [Clostridiales bacterium]
MKEERMFILNMLNDGKITSDDACKLLAALKTSDGKSSSSSEIGDKVEKYAKDIKAKVSKMAKDAEPTVKKYAGAVSDKIDDIRESFKTKKAASASDDEIIIIDEEEDAAREEASENTSGEA